MNKTLVAYFSASGVTRGVARQLAETIHADLFEIEPEVPYTEADLDWMDKYSRSTIEMNDSSSRPAIKNKVANISQYDTVLIGFPIWWFIAPTIINTFIEAHDLDGKRVVPFATSATSTIRKASVELRNAYPQLTWEEGRLLKTGDEQEIAGWLNN